MYASSSVSGRRMRRVQLPMLVLSMVAAALIGMASSSQAAVDQTTPKKAALVFAKALMDGDMELVKQVAVGSDKEFAIVKSLGDMLQAMKRYEAAAVKKYGDEGKVSKEENKDLVMEVEASEEKIEGDKATLINKGNPNEKNPMTLKKDGAAWKVDLSTLSKDQDSARILDLSKAMVTALDGATKDVEAGKYKTAKEAKSAMEAAMLSTMLKTPGEK